MKNIFKDIFFSFIALSFVVFSSGLNTSKLIAKAQEADNQEIVSNEELPKDTVEQLVQPPVVELVKPYSEWCSVLLGAVSYAKDQGHYSNLADINNDEVVDLSDWTWVSEMYGSGNDASCYSQFMPEAPIFTCYDYKEIGWCQGLLQGVKDSLGSQSNDYNYNERFDLNSDGAINLTDTVLAVQLVDKNDQAKCYEEHFVPPFSSCIEAPKPYAPWCSALLGIVSQAANSGVYSDVADINNDESVNLSDVVLATQMQDTADDAHCYQQFEDPQGQFHFTCENYTSVGWCQGLVQGVKDSTGSKVGDSNYNDIYDINNDGVINLTDVVLVAQLDGQNDQAACYAHYQPPMPQCPAPVVAVCGNGEVETGEVCDDGNTNTEICGDNEVNNGTFCNATCTTTLTLAETCDAGTEGSSSCTPQCTVINPTPPQPGPSGGGGGGGGGGVILPPNAYSSSIAPLCQQTTINWQTSNDSITWLVYGTDQSYGQEVKESVYKVSHSVVLTGLLPGTTYYYQIKTQGSNGLVKADALNGSFTTPTAQQCASGIIPEVLGTKEEACRFVKPNDGIAQIDKDIMNVFDFPNGALIRSVCDPNMSIYVLVSGKKFHIPNWQYLYDHYFGQRIFNVQDIAVYQYPDITGNVLGVKIYPNGTLLRGKNKRVYIIENSHKRYISSLAELKKYAGQQIIDVSDSVLGEY